MLLSILSCIRSFAILTEFSFDHISSILSVPCAVLLESSFSVLPTLLCSFVIFSRTQDSSSGYRCWISLSIRFSALNFTALTIPSFSFEESLYNSYLPKAFITFFGFYKNSYVLVIIFVSCNYLMSFSKSLQVFISPYFLYVFFALFSAFWYLLLILVINIGHCSRAFWIISCNACLTIQTIILIFSLYWSLIKLPFDWILGQKLIKSFLFHDLPQPFGHWNEYFGIVWIDFPLTSISIIKLFDAFDKYLNNFLYLITFSLAVVPST